MKNTPLTRGPRNLLFIVLFLVVCVALLTKLTDYSRLVRTMPYSAFLQAVESGSVKSVHLAGQEASGIMKDGTRFEAVVAESPKNLEILKEYGVEFSVSNSSTQFSIWHLVLILLCIVTVGAVWYFLRQSRGSNGGSTIFSMGRSRAKMFAPSTIKERFDSVAGAHEAKEELKTVIDYLKNPEKYRKLGAKVSRGVLLVGEPGNGKTLLAKATAGEVNCPFFSITGSDFIEVFVGVGASRVRDLFEKARKQAPCIIFIDEIDAIGRQRGSGFGGGHDEREQTLNQLLTEMDGFETGGAPVVVLAATNMPDVLDKALLRPGRFDRRISVPFPDTDSREQILKIHARSIKVDPSVDLRKVAEETAGFSGADLANLINKAALTASKNNQAAVSEQDLHDAHQSILQSNISSNGQANPLTKGTSKPKMFMPSQMKITFNDVAGAEEAKEELKECVDFLRNPKKFQRLGARVPRGILLTGEPGNGKTLLAKAVAGEANCPFFSVSASEFVEMYVGVGASRIRDLFAQARRHNPSIIFIDEIDAAGTTRSSSIDGGGQSEYNQTLNQLLSEMDGFDNETSVIVIAATNRPDVLDKALVRPGRFDKSIYVPLPNLVSREKILAIHAKKLTLAEDVNLTTIARGTTGFSGAHLAQLVNEAALHATKNEEQVVVTMHDFEAARDKILLGKESKSIVMSERERELTAYHEAGHALVPLMMPEHSDPLHKITILPRGHALGVTFSLPERDKYTETKDELLALIMRAMGGRVAEELIFNVVASGASSDFKMATDVARKMVCVYGMSERLGKVSYEGRGSRFGHSDQTAHAIDAEVQSILEDCYQKTRELLATHRDKLEAIAKTLLERETMYAREIYELLGITPREDFKFA